ncbi:aminoacylase-1A-like [Ochlerotatus camptorhynchus]|uniref:aminoacylase-1A-like n=1 Tax=Ochlerotatus camptorhynchus TaxID=644619 RepID=UPI0031D4A219
MESRYQLWESNDYIKLFREYLRIESVHPNVNYDKCVEFLQRQADLLELPLTIDEVNPGKPVVIISWEGTDPGMDSIFLNSHMDVVPVYAEKWTYPPFSAHMDNEGRIYARGTQDMKSVGIQYLSAIQELRKEKQRFKRTVHVVFMPDEEIGGELGMNDFVKTDHFKKLNCGFGMDEGFASEEDVFKLYYGERTIKRAYFHISGTSGHGSLLLERTVGEKARKLMDKIFDFREKESKRLDSNPGLTIGDVTTMNVTSMSGGVQTNVVPPELKICVDIRVAINVDLRQFELMLETWCDESGDSIRIEYDGDYPFIEPTKLDGTNKYWLAFKAAMDDMNLKVRPQIKAGASDIRHVRKLGIPAIGFSPINRTPVLLHDHNEYLQADTFLRGIDIYKNIIQAVANA